MSCTAEEIAEKRRVAQERLRERQQQSAAVTPKRVTTTNDNNNTLSVNTATASTSTSPTARSFYGKALASNSSKAAELENYEAKIRSEPPYKNKNRILSQPYPTKDARTVAQTAKTNEPKKTPFGQKSVTCTCAMISSSRFHVTIDGYHAKLIDVFKTIPTRSYGMKRTYFFFHIMMAICACKFSQIN